ncbi:MAG TPA: outer membrane beta-barrel protein, partial [Rhizomicrobium sp.]|nr:outer membrane beta-barrel protein [Rhizomicrobium sp.]
MKLRLLALATVAAAALSTPAMAGDGWYLGLGGGYDAQNGLSLRSVPNPNALTVKAQSSDNAIGAIAIGYGFPGTGWRLENELAFTQHDISVSTASGGNQITSDMVNLAYDFPFADNWKFTLGAGIGVGGFRGALRTNGTQFDIFRGGNSAFQWQLIGGLAVSISPDVDLFAEYRYRENELDSNFNSSYLQITPVRVGAVKENVGMFGLRWFLTPPPPPP